MRKLLMILLTVCSCQTIQTRKQYEPPKPEKPKYSFRILPTDDGQLACLNNADIQKLFQELKDCRGHSTNE